jgi:hypothetical protein
MGRGGVGETVTRATPLLQHGAPDALAKDELGGFRDAVAGAGQPR